MTIQEKAAEAALRGLRVLVVDNDRVLREQTVELLRRWGCDPVAPEGEGDVLLAGAREAARRHCCQLALVDMRLFDDDDNSDISGLKLASELGPTLSIVMSNHGDFRTVKQAFHDYHVLDFIPKVDGPEALERALRHEVAAHTIGGRHMEIEWAGLLSSAALGERLVDQSRNAPADEADDLLGRMFRPARRLVLTPLAADAPASDMPLSPSALPSLRRDSRIFLAQIDDQPALTVVKIAKRQKILHEIDNYQRYVENGLPSLFRPELRCKLALWNLGAVGYRFVGNSDLSSSDTFPSFYNFYRATEDPEQILAPLRHFFDPGNWGYWYQTNVTPLGRSLFSAYDEMLRHKLSRYFPEWGAQRPRMGFAGIADDMPNPMRWLADNHTRSSEVLNSRQAVTHGDLHGDNLFVSATHAWPIDFERTGPGPILRDFIELVQDILTRAALFGPADLPLVYDLAVAICAPQHPGRPMRSTARIEAHPEARKALRVVAGLQRLAVDLARYSDRREYLWGLLFNHLFVLARLHEHRSTPRYQHTALMASVICRRLSGWGPAAPWPPPGWPPVDWVDPEREGGPAAADAQRADGRRAKGPAAPRFAHGHALLVGVGGDLPNTVDDARALHELLTDPERCAYPPAQVALLAGPDATRPAILEGLGRLAEAARGDPEAVVTVYFSGHGVLSPESYLLAHGYRLQQLAETAVTGAELSERLRAIGARRLLVLLDCCHAGGMAEVKGVQIQPTSLPPELAALGAGGGRVLIASSRRDEVSYAGRPYSVFTQALREALAGYGASESDGYAYVADVALYVGRKVPERTGGRQHPILKLARADNFPIAYYAGGAAEPKGLPGVAAAPLIHGAPPALGEIYRQVLQRHQQSLLAVELQMAEFIDQATVPLDLRRTRDGLLERIGEAEGRLRAAG